VQRVRPRDHQAHEVKQSQKSRRIDINSKRRDFTRHVSKQKTGSVTSFNLMCPANRFFSEAIRSTKSRVPGFVVLRRSDLLVIVFFLFDLRIATSCVVIAKDTKESVRYGAAREYRKNNQANEECSFTHQGLFGTEKEFVVERHFVPADKLLIKVALDRNF